MKPAPTKRPSSASGETSALRPVPAVRPSRRFPVREHGPRRVAPRERGHAEAQARQLAKSTVKTIVAVSCDPATFARDAEILVGGGYKQKSLTAVDQFKWTSHVEIVGTFGR